MPLCPISRSNPRSPRKAIAILAVSSISATSIVPILDRPERQSQCAIGVATPWEIVFQSSIAPKGNRNSPRQLHQAIESVPILDRPERQSQCGWKRSIMANRGFQSSIAPKGNRNDLPGSSLFVILSSNPRSPRKAIAMSSPMHSKPLRSSNPRSPRKAIAIRHYSDPSLF